MFLNVSTLDHQLNSLKPKEQTPMLKGVSEEKAERENYQKLEYQFAFEHSCFYQSYDKIYK